MADLNKANRQTCDVDIRDLKTKKPFLFFDTANTTTSGLSSENTYAMAKGSKRIAFANPLEGTMSIEAQVYPFKLFSLMSDGVIETTAVYATTQVVTGSEGSLTITPPGEGTVVEGSVFVYPEESFGDEATAIDGSFETKTFTAEGVHASTQYKVGYLVKRTSGIKKITFNNKRTPKDYFVTQSTLDKDEEGVLTPFVMTAYHAVPQRNFEVAFSSEGDPATVTVTFDLLEDKDGNVFDMVELTADAK